MSHIFVSYAHADKAYVLKLVNFLREHGFEVWMDDDIPNGERWAKEIFDRLRTSSALIVVMSPDSERSEWVEKEVLVAHRQGMPILPLSLSETLFPLLIDRQAESIRDEALPSDRFIGNLARVIEHRSAIQAKSTADPSISGLLDEQRRSDPRLLKVLWETINSENVEHLDAALQFKALTQKCYRRFKRYLRNRRKKPEWRFIDPEVDALFSTFDEGLEAFFSQFMLSAGFYNPGPNSRVMPDYRDAPTAEIEAYKLEEWEKTIDRVLEVKEAHRVLVTALKRQFPEFDFQSEFNCED